MEDSKIRIQAGYKLYDAWWEMEIDLDMIAADAGRKVKEKMRDWDGSWIEMVHVVYPISRASSSRYPSIAFPIPRFQNSRYRAIATEQRWRTLRLGP